MELKTNHLSFAYDPGNTILHDISLKITSGEILFILGRNGSGKSTLLSCLAGLLKFNSGSVLLENRSLFEYSSSERAQLIGLIPQMHLPVFAYTVHELVLMGRTPYLGWIESPSKQDHHIVDHALDQVGLYELKGRAFNEISGGEQQLALIARGLAQNCQVLLMDEPTTHLDLCNKHQVLEIVKHLSKKGLSFIVASHAPNDAIAYADQVMLLNGGWVTATGPPHATITEDSLSLIYGIDTEIIYEEVNGSKKAKAVIPRSPSQLDPEAINEPGNMLYDIFSEKHDTPQLMLVTGLRGAGKTTWCSELTGIAKEKGMVVKGILSPGIFKGNQKIGITAKNIETGDQLQLAILRKGEVEGMSTPRWQFFPETVSWANKVIGEAEESDLLMIDEIGPLELLRGEGLTAGIDRLDGNRYKIACVVIRPSLIPSALHRWPHAKVVSGSSQKNYLPQ